MQRFKVEIHGEDLEVAMAAVHGAGIPTIGPAFTWYGEGEPQQARVGDQMLAVVDAETAEGAEAHVREVLPVGDYVLKSAGLWQ
jgi:hypothetical protein